MRSRQQSSPSAGAPNNFQLARFVASQTVTLTIMALWVAYSASQTLFVTGRLSEPAAVALAFLSGLAGVLSLRQGGFPQETCFLQLRRPSRGSLIALLVLSLALWPVLAGGRWVGANLQAAFLQAAGGVAQELFFRAVLLPLLLALFPGRPLRAIFLHAVLFSIWHAGAFLVTPAGMIAGPIAIMTVSFIGGLVWGVVTVRDGTVVWATIQHTLFWVIGSMFALGPP